MTIIARLVYGGMVLMGLDIIGNTVSDTSKTARNLKLPLLVFGSVMLLRELKRK